MTGVEVDAEHWRTTLARLDHPGWQAGYDRGLLDGIELGRAQVIAEDEARWARVRRTVRRYAEIPSFAVVSQRRGEHDRAERALTHEVRLGLREAVQ